MLRAYFGLIDIFVNYYFEEARYAFFKNAHFLIKITSTSLTAQNETYILIKKKLPDALALDAFSMFGLTILFFNSHVTYS